MTIVGMCQCTTCGALVRIACPVCSPSADFIDRVAKFNGGRLRCVETADGRLAILKEDVEMYLRHMDSELERALKADEEGE